LVSSYPNYTSQALDPLPVYGSENLRKSQEIVTQNALEKLQSEDYIMDNWRLAFAGKKIMLGSG
jgi:hypothetical protein